SMSISQFKKKISTSLHDNIYFDKNDFLREKAINFSVLNLLIDEAQDLIISSNKNERYFLYGILGYLYRVTGKPKKAIEYLTFTLDYFEEKDDIKEVISLIRLGEAYKYDDQHHVALDKFNKALKICEVEQIDEYLDFA